MFKTNYYCYAVLLCLSFCLSARAQDSTQKLPARYAEQVSSRISRLEKILDSKSEKLLTSQRRLEEKLRRKLSRLDSAKSAQLFSSLNEKRKSLEKKLEEPGSFTEYIPFLDTLKTSLRFLEQSPEWASSLRQSSPQLSSALSKITELEGELAKAESIKAFLKERREYLQQQLEKFRFARDLKKLNKQAYYYAAQMREYKELLKDPGKIERKALELLSRTKAFQDFMQENSQLASLFRLPASEPSMASLQDLQTRAQVNALVQDRLGSGGSNAEAILRENIQAAQAQLSQLKDRAAALGQGSIGSAGDGELPDFKPNSQKTRSFLQRLELGTNLQTQKGSHFFPITSDIGLSLGYKINDKSIAGFGASYKLGLGTGWNNIAVSHQGFGLRSFVDMKVKGSIYISGGYEQNYRSEFRSFQALKDYSAWQSSGLIGLSKKYQVSKKFKGEMKLLWDFLSYRQVPRTQAVLFRIGYSLK